jgi:hypothetical protein
VSRDVLADFLPWTPIGSHAATCWLQRHTLPADVERLADALYGKPGPFGVEYGRIEAVVGAAPVRPVGTSLLEIADDGRWAALQPVEDAGGEVVDLIAWHPAMPAQWRLLTGAGEALGLRELDMLGEGETIICYASPANWLRADGRGLCLLSEDWAVVQRILIGERRVGAETAELGRRLDKILRYRPSPEILVLEHAA